MATEDDVRRVQKNIADIYEVRKAYIYALCVAYAGYALRRFRSRQPAMIGARGRYWVNRTGQAAARFFAKAFKRGTTLGWMVAHGVPYGVYLELANDRRNQAIKPIIEAFSGPFFTAVRDYVGPAGKIDGAPGQ